MQWQSEYNPLKGPGSLGLKLDHSAFIEPFIEPHQKRRKNLQIAKKKDVKARFGKSDTIDKLKASNFQAIHLKIGLWEVTSYRFISHYKGFFTFFDMHKGKYEIVKKIDDIRPWLLTVLLYKKETCFTLSYCVAV